MSQEQRALGAMVAEYIDATAPLGQQRALFEVAGNYDADLWRGLADLGLLIPHVPEKFGGAGGSFLDLVVVLEAMGRHLLYSPYFATTCLAANAILHVGSDEDRERYLPVIGSGALTATLAIVEDDGQWDPGSVALAAGLDGPSQFRLTGSKMFVLDGDTADLLIVVGRSEEGIALFAVDADAEGLSRETLAPLDLTRPMSRIEFHETPAARVGDTDHSGHQVAEVIRHAVVCLAADQVGGAERCLELSATYAKTRHQFGRPIGAFQAIQHKCAEMLMRVEYARSALHYTAALADVREPSDEFAIMTSATKSFCSDAFVANAADMIQIHGGIGFTWEHDAHLFFRRAKADEQLLGSPSCHRDQLLTLAGW